MSKLAELLNSLVEARIKDTGSAPETYGRLMAEADLSKDELREYLTEDSDLYTGDPTFLPMMVPGDIRNFAAFFEVDPGEMLAAALEDGLLTPVEEEKSTGPALREVLPTEQYQRLLEVKAQLDQALDA
jgi:hypothetical protein